MKYTTLHDLFLLKLGALYDTEKEIVKALPKMAKKATNLELKAAFEEHLEITNGHIDRLDEVFESLGEKPKKVKSEAIRGIIEDAKWLIDQDMSPEALDAALIAAAQYVEHYEMGGYGTALAWAEQMGHTEAAELLEETLEEEKEADSQLTELAESSMNEKALAGEEPQEE